MLPHQQLTIPEAAILFYSDHYQNLKCKIIQKQTSNILCSKLINNCVETTCSINRGLQQFIVQLFQGATLVALFDFNYEDFQEALAMDNCQYQIGNKKRKYVKFKKENDCCALYFTIQLKDVLLNERHTQEEYIYEDYVRQIANKVYKKLEVKALKRIENLENFKMQNKRMSGPNDKLIKQMEKSPELSRFKRQHQRDESIKLEMPQSNNKESDKMPIFAQSCLISLAQYCFGQQSEHSKKKSQYRLKRLKEKAKKLFHKQIQELQEKDTVVIPQVKMTKRNMGLLSEGIVFPTRIRSQNTKQKDLGIKMNGFIETYQIDNQRQNISKTNFSTNMFESSGFVFKKQRKTSTLKPPDPTPPPIKLPNPPILKQSSQKYGTLKKSCSNSNVDINFNQTVRINSKAAIKYKLLR